MRIFFNAWQPVHAIGSSLTNPFDSQASPIGSTVTNQLEHFNFSLFVSISFSHHIEIILKTVEVAERWYYIEHAAIHFWTVRHLRTELNNQSHLKGINQSNNFQSSLPKEISNQAIRAFKDQYLLDFVNIEDADEEIDERVLEKDNKIVEYSFRDFSKPLGVATYKTSETLPPELQHALPDAETLKKLME